MSITETPMGGTVKVSIKGANAREQKQRYIENYPPQGYATRFQSFLDPRSGEWYYEGDRYASCD